MSLLPYILSELDDLSYPNIYDQHFGLGLQNHDLLHHAAPRILSVPFRSGYVRPFRRIAEDDSGVSNFAIDKDGLKVNLDVQQFKPEEIDVKVVDDYVVVHAKHEERSDQHGYISREFTRRYKIPETVNAEALASKLSSDGILTIQAPKKAIAADGGQQRSIPVVQTNQPAIKQATKKDEQKKNQSADKMES